MSEVTTKPRTFEIRMRMTAPEQFFAMIHCTRCGSTFSSGEWMTNQRSAVEEARTGIEGHERQYPNCQRPK